MGRSDDSISKSSSAADTASAHHGNSPFPARGYPSSQITPPLSSSVPGLGDGQTYYFSQDISAVYSQPSDYDVTSSYAVRCDASAPGDVFLAHTPGGIPNTFSSSGIPATIVASYNTTAQSYDVDYMDASRQRDMNSSSYSSTHSSPNAYFISDDVPPAQLMGHVPQSQDTGFQSSIFSSHGSRVIPLRYEGDTSHASRPHVAASHVSAYRDDLAPQSPSPSPSLTSTLSSGIAYSNTYHPTSFTNHTSQLCNVERSSVYRSSNNGAHFFHGHPSHDLILESTSPSTSPTPAPASDMHAYHTTSLASRASRFCDTGLPAPTYGSSGDPLHGRATHDLATQSPSPLISLTPTVRPETPHLNEYHPTTSPSHVSQLRAPELTISTHGRFRNRTHLLPGYSTHDLALQPPSPSASSTSVSWLDIPNTPLACRNSRVVEIHQYGGQQSNVPRIFIDMDDISGQGLSDDSITIGQCHRTDNSCGLWMKVDKRSIKRHAQIWHEVARGGDTRKVPCTWSGCTEEMRQGSIPRHIVHQHFGERFQCNGCSTHYTRRLNWNNHAQSCVSSGLGCTVVYFDHIRVVDVETMSLRA